MKPHEACPSGDESGGSGSGSGGEEEELSLEDAAWPARALAALNQLRKSRQHYDVVLVAGGAEVAAHRAVLAAASPRLLRDLAAPGPHRLDVEAAALRALVDHAYTGRLPVRSPEHGRALYRAAARLRLEAARDQLAAALLRRPAPRHALLLRALPDLEPARLAALDHFIADHFDEICESGALAALPEIRIEMMRDSSRAGGDEAPLAVADAALAWLLDAGGDVEELSARSHLVYVDARGALRDCGELPAARGDAPELQLYRREAAARRHARPPAAPAAAGRVLAARRAAGGARALLVLGGRAAGARLAWTDVAAGGGGVARGAALGGAAAAQLAHARAALGVAAVGGRLLACGGYDRARVLRAAETYDPAENAWGAAADMRGPRARFPVAVLGDEVWALGGSDGQAELASVEAWSAARGWRAGARLPAGVSHAGAAADEARGELYLVGGWAGGGTVSRVLVLAPGDAAPAWREAAALGAGRAQAACAWWRGALWAVGGCDAWRCLAAVERLAPGAAQWTAGPALPTARRAAGACEWRGRLVAAGGSDGAASLRRTEWLAAAEAGWRPGPALRRPRAALGLAALGEALYAVGGFDGAEFLSCVEVLAAPDAEWTQLLAAPPPRAPLPATTEQKEGEAAPQ